MTIQLASAEDVFLWPDGTQCTRDEYERGEFNHQSDDYEVVPVGSPRYAVVAEGSGE